MMQVMCPSCRGPLTAPAEMAGTMVRCPRCNCQMLLPSPGAAPPLPAASPMHPAATEPSPPPVSGSAASKRYRSEDLLPPAAAVPPGAPPATATAPPPSSGGTAKLRLPARPAATPGSSATTTQAPPTGPAAPAAPTAMPPAASPVAASPVAATATPAVPTARFIAKRDATAAVELPGGALPTLQLADKVEKSSVLRRNVAWRGPTVTVLLILSVLSSAVMLLWEPGETRSVAPAKQDAWRRLEEVYFGQGDALRPYQRLLRQAQQAHHQRRRSQEVALLRQVLDLLRAERPNPNFGVTGFQTPFPPNDADLEQLVTLLLRED